MGNVQIGRFEELPNRIRAEDIVLDVGGGCRPLSRADFVLDFLPWDNNQQAEPYFRELWPTPHFSKENWVQWDLCSHQAWPFKDKQFDFVVCKQTLEDLRDPVWVCQEMMRVGKGGFIEVPHRVIESIPGIERSRYCRYSHHHWMCEVTDAGIEFIFKHAQIHGYSRFHLSIGPSWNRGARDHHWSEFFDILEPVSLVINRWFRTVNPKYAAIGFFWKNSFHCRERVLIEKGDVEADLMGFKERCRKLNDIWVRKRTWYGKRIRYQERSL